MNRRTDVGLGTVLGDAPQPHLAPVGNGHHLLASGAHLRVDGDPLDAVVDVRAREDLLPAAGILQSASTLQWQSELQMLIYNEPVANGEMGVRDYDPVVVRLYDLHPQRICPTQSCKKRIDFY